MGLKGCTGFDMQAGRLDKLVELQRAVKGAADDYGHRVDTWRPYAQAWVRIEEATGEERFLSQQVQAGLTTKVTMRVRDDLQSADRIVYDGRNLEIVEILQASRMHGRTDLLCKEIVGD